MRVASNEHLIVQRSNLVQICFCTFVAYATPCIGITYMECFQKDRNEALYQKNHRSVTGREPRGRYFWEKYWGFQDPRKFINIPEHKYLPISLSYFGLFWVILSKDCPLVETMDTKLCCNQVATEREDDQAHTSKEAAGENLDKNTGKCAL